MSPAIRDHRQQRFQLFPVHFCWQQASSFTHSLLLPSFQNNCTIPIWPNSQARSPGVGSTAGTMEPYFRPACQRVAAAGAETLLLGSPRSLQGCWCNWSQWGVGEPRTSSLCVPDLAPVSPTTTKDAQWSTVPSPWGIVSSRYFHRWVAKGHGEKKVCRLLIECLICLNI